MDKISVYALVLCIALMVGAPVMGMDNYLHETRGKGDMENPPEALTVLDTTAADKFPFIRVQTVFKMADEFSSTDPFSDFYAAGIGSVKSFPTNSSSPYNPTSGESGDNVSFDQAYLNIQTPYGILDIGRTETLNFGSFLGGNDRIGERIRYTLPVDDLTILAIVGKRIEKNNQSQSIKDLQHPDVYSLAGIYKLPIGSTGFMVNYDTHHPDKDLEQKAFLINPYFDVNVAGWNISGEARYQWGDIKNALGADMEANISRFAANIEMNMPLGPVLMTTGYAFKGGDADYRDGNADNQHTYFNGGTARNRNKTWILAGDEAATAEIIGVPDDFVKDARIYGSKLMYLGASLSPIDNLDVGLLIASSRAEDVPSGMKDHHGVEWDVSLSYQIFNNVSYDFIAAFLAAGDFWKDLDPDLNVENSFALYQQLKLKF